VKNKQIDNSFIQKTYKKGLLPIHFYHLTVEVRKRGFGQKLPVKIVENPTVGIERRLLRVIHNILVFISIRLKFIFRSLILFFGGLLV